MMVKHKWDKKWERGTKETICTKCGITKKVVSGTYVYYEKGYTDLALFMFNAPSCLEQENSHFVNTPVIGSVSDLEEKRRKLTDKYIETHCGNYTDKEKIIARNAIQIGWELRKHCR